MATKVQEELEQPVKGYQLLVISEKIDILLERTSSLVTITQLEQCEKKIIENVDNKIEQIHLKYEPFTSEVEQSKKDKRQLTMLVVGAVLTGMVDILLQILFVYPRLK